jgi:hypothetical protein
MLSFESSRRCRKKLVPCLGRHRDMRAARHFGIPHQHTCAYEGGLDALSASTIAVRRGEPCRTVGVRVLFNAHCAYSFRTDLISWVER